MRKKEILLKVMSILAVLLGLAFATVGLFIRMIRGMDTSWFISRFGPNGEEAYRTYDKLYEMSLVLVGVANRYTMALYVTLGVGFLVFGITCGLWARDLKRQH